MRLPRVLKVWLWSSLDVLCFLLRLRGVIDIPQIKDNRWTILDGEFFLSQPEEGAADRYRDEPYCSDTNDSRIENLPSYPE